LKPFFQICQSKVLVFVSSFLSIFISFLKIQKLDGLKSKKLEAPFRELLSFSLLGSFNFLISQKLIHKSDKILKQTPS
jgi:hypothetical protein